VSGDRAGGGPASPSAAVVVSVNGSDRAVAAGASVADLVAELGLAGRPLAVELNGAVLPRPRLAGCMLSAGDRVEIVTLVGGG